MNPSAKQQHLFIPDPYKTFSEKLNGRAAMLGLLIGLVVEAFTDRGIVEQVGASSRASVLDLSLLTDLLSGLFS